MKTFLRSFLVFTIFSATFYACGKKQGDNIQIGVIGPMTGEGATYGIAMKRGIDLAIDEVNAHGGVLGKQIKTVYEDDKLRPSEGVSAINKLINYDHVQTIIGSAASTVTLAIAPVAEKAKVVLISSISTADTIKYAGDYIFRDVPPNKQQGQSAAKFVFRDLKMNDAAVFFKNDDYGLSLSQAFIQAFKDLGGNVLTIESYNPGQTDYRNQLAKIKASNPKTVFFPGNYEDSGLILRQSSQIGLKAVFIGGDGSYSPELVRIAGKSADGSFYTVMSLPPDTSSRFLAFKVRYRSMYNEDPDVYSVYSYDAAKAILRAIEISGVDDGEKIKEALYKVQFEGISGPIQFDSFGEVDRDYSIYTIKDGSFVLFR